MAKLLVAEGAQNIAVGTPVALLVEEEEELAAFKDYTPAAGGAPAASSAAAAEAPPAAAAAGPVSSAPAGRHHSDRLGPAARTLLEEAGLTADDVTPTGPHGIITKGDVLAAVAAGVKHGASATVAQAVAPAAAKPAAPAPQQQQQQQPAAAPAAPAVPAVVAPRPAAGSAGAAYTDIPNSQIRKIIAQRLVESKQTIPHL